MFDSKKNVYTFSNSTSNNSEKWTWGKVSSSVLKYMQSHDPKVPKFVPLISKTSSVNDKSSSCYEYGRTLFDLTRYSFDHLKKDPLLDLNELLDKRYKKIVYKSKKLQFGSMEPNNEPINEKPKQDEIDKLIDSKIKKAISILYKSQKKMIKQSKKDLKYEICLRMSEYEKKMMSSCGCASRCNQNTNTSAFNCPPLACDSNMDLNLNDPAKNAGQIHSIFGALGGTPNPPPYNPFPAVPPAVPPVAPPILPFAPGSPLPPLVTPPIVTGIPIAPPPAAAGGIFGASPFIPPAPGTGSAMAFGSEKPNLTVDLPSVLVNSSDSNSKSLVSYLMKMLQSLSPQQNSVLPPNTKQHEEIIADCTLNADLLEFQKKNLVSTNFEKTKHVDADKCCNININVINTNNNKTNNQDDDGNCKSALKDIVFQNDCMTQKPKQLLCDQAENDVLNIVIEKSEHDENKNQPTIYEQIVETLSAANDEVPVIHLEKQPACFGSTNEEAFGYSQSMGFFDDISCVKKK